MHPHYNADTLEFYVREFRMKPMLFEVVILTKTDNDIGHTQFNLLMRLSVALAFRFQPLSR